MAESYGGPKFSCDLRKQRPELGDDENRAAIQLLDCCKRFHSMGLAPEYDHATGKGTSGNYSFRTANGFLVTATPKHAASMTLDDLTLVTGGNLQANALAATGLKPPSSEALMHFAIYSAKPGAGAIVHWHDDQMLNNVPEGIVETEGEAPAGTVEFAKLAAKAASSISGTNGVIALKGHGFVAFGKDIDEAERAPLSFY